MENVVLIVHLLLALTLIGVVLLQRSEGGGLGMGSGGGGGGAMTGRSAASALAKVTWILAIGFIITSMTLLKTKNKVHMLIYFAPKQLNGRLGMFLFIHTYIID